MGLTAVDDVGLADSPVHCPQTSLHFGNHPGLEGGQELLERGRADEWHQRAAVGISGEDGGLLRARQRLATVDGHKVDVGLVGDVVDVSPQPIIDLLDQGRIPVISSVAPLTTDSETVLNVNADTAAAAIAVALKARTLLMLTDVEGLYSAWPDRDSLVPFISAAALEELLPTLESGMIPKMEACLRAVYGGVAQAHVVDGRQAHSMLLEIVTDQGVGTVIHPGDAPVPPLNGGKSL